MAATCGDRTTDRRAHTRAAAGARHGTDSATLAGTAGPLATGHTRGPDPRRAGSASWRVRPADARPVSVKPGGSKQGQREPEQRRELLDASPQLQDLLSEFRLREVRHIQTDHDRRRRAEPATRRRARDSEVRGDGHVPGALDEIPKPVVVALLRAGRGRHGDDHRPFRSRRSTPRGRWGASEPA